jgi:hypothetical protein
LGLNEADTFKSSSILIYSDIALSIFCIKCWLDAMGIEKQEETNNTQMVEEEVKDGRKFTNNFK